MTKGISRKDSILMSAKAGHKHPHHPGNEHKMECYMPHGDSVKSKPAAKPEVPLSIFRRPSTLTKVQSQDLVRRLS